MASRFLSTLPDAPAVLRRMTLRAPSAAGRESPDFRVFSPAETLGGLFGLGGTLRMADHLAAPPKRSGDRGVAPSEAKILRYVGDRSAAIRLEAISALASPFTGSNAVPDADALFAALEKAGALGNKQRRRWEKAGKVLGPKYARPFGAAVAQARKRLTWMRADVLEMVRAGAHDEALVAFDVCLFESTEAGVRRSLERAEAALAAHFGESLVEAGKRLAPAAGRSDVAIWVERGGFVEVFLRQTGELALAIVDREIDAVRALAVGALATVVAGASS